MVRVAWKHDPAFIFARSAEIAVNVLLLFVA